MMHLWWLSFADEDGWKGGCFIEAQHFENAVVIATGLGINPGGEIQGVGKGLTDEEEAEFKSKFKVGVLYTRDTLPDTPVMWKPNDRHNS